MTNPRATTPADPTDRHSRPRSPRRRLAFTLGAVAAAVAAAVAVPLAGGAHGKQAAAAPSDATAAQRTASSSASSSIDIVTTDYTVQSVPNGTIAVQLMNTKGIPGLQTALRQAGIPAAVMGFSASCHATVDTDGSIDPQKVSPPSANGRITLIRLSAVPKGEHLLFEPMTAANGKVGTLQLSVVRQVPSCVPESQNGIGEGYVAPGTNP